MHLSPKSDDLLVVIYIKLEKIREDGKSFFNAKIRPIS
jgi:hypothetical protein